MKMFILIYLLYLFYTTHCLCNLMEKLTKHYNKTTGLQCMNEIMMEMTSEKFRVNSNIIAQFHKDNEGNVLIAFQKQYLEEGPECAINVARENINVLFNDIRILFLAKTLSREEISSILDASFVDAFLHFVQPLSEVSLFPNIYTTEQRIFWTPFSSKHPLQN